MRRILPILVSLLFTVAAMAQTAPEWSERGDVAARNDRHQEAIAAYRQAIALDPALHALLRVRLARQHLWAGEHDRAIGLLREHLGEHPGDCEARNDFGLALAWSDRLAEALEQYRIVATECPALRENALLRQALVLRWQDRPSAARAIYASLVASEDAAVRREAEEGLGLVDLMIDANRSARHRFAALEGESPTAVDGLAIAQYRLGNVREAKEIIETAAGHGDLSRDLTDLQEPVASFDRPQIRVGATAFRDADGTRMQALEAGVSRGWGLRGRGEVAAGWSTLTSDSRDVAARWVEVSGEHRWSEAAAARARLRATDHEDGWTPWSGEIGWIATPRDGLRIDLAAARLLVADNVPAIDNRLHGDFVSAGFDRSLAHRDSLAASVDVTRWSEGNRRVRIRVAPARVLEGVPRVTISWPTLVQSYDQPFAFGLWSPERYVETGPGVNVYRRWRRVWNLSGYVRSGAQREDSGPWRWLGVARVAAERDLRDAWALRVSAGWSNSNVAGSGGFRRTSVEFEVLKRF